MGSNILPTSAKPLIGLGGKMYKGMLELGPALHLTLITAEQFDANLTEFITQDTAFNAQRSAQLAASVAFQEKMDKVYPWLLGVSNTLATAWGTRWSTQWTQAGFINNSTGIPVKIEDRLGLLLALISFFTKNPDYEVPSQDQTADYGTALRTAALTAQTAAMAAVVALKTIGDKWDTAYGTLVDGMKALLKNLEVELAGDDPRWLKFGLQMPASITTPGQPVNLAAHLDATGAVVAQCDAVPLATRYRFRMRLAGVQPDYALAFSSKEPMGAITGVLPGQTAEIIVQAVNGNLQGVASEPILFTVPLPVAAGKAAPESKALPAQEPAAGGEHANGNGHRNGHGNGAHAARAALM